jgi:hypothetical protein
MNQGDFNNNNKKHSLDHGMLLSPWVDAIQKFHDAASNHARQGMSMI